jgi:hypothetical protein
VWKILILWLCCWQYSFSSPSAPLHPNPLHLPRTPLLKPGNFLTISLHKTMPFSLTNKVTWSLLSIVTQATSAK